MKIKYDTLALEDTVRLIGELNAAYNHLIASMSVEYDPEMKEKMLIAARLIQQERRKYSAELKDKLGMDEKLYCVVGKHLPTAIVLAGEVGYDAENIYAVLASLTDGKIEPCSSCSEDASKAKEENE